MITTIEEIGADGQPNNMFKFAKAKTAADTDGSESKDTFERSGKQEAEKCIWAKEPRVYLLEKKKENQAWHLT